MMSDMTTITSAALLSRVGLGPDVSASAARLPDSPARFADGTRYRIEIPSVEGPACLSAVIDEAARRDVAIHRCSQGSGVTMHTDAELDEVVALAASAAIEVSLFARPTAAWGVASAALAGGGGAMAGACLGLGQLTAALDEVRRAADHGIRSALISDIGLLAAFGRLRREGALPADLLAKASVLLPVLNPAGAKLAVELGADTLNVSSDLTLEDLAAIRAVTDAPMDIYVEVPDDLGGFVRLHEMPEIVRVAAPVYLKFGLRNAPSVYPSGLHIEATAVALVREKVRRARVGMELLERAGVEPCAPAARASDLGVPVGA